MPGPVKVPVWLQRLFPDLLWHVNDPEKKLYLTFDDGPTPHVTPRVIEILSHYQARATFFCIGRNAERHPAIYNQILAAGHLTGNHTYSHLKGWYTPNPVYYDDIRLAGLFIRSTLYRPAYGMITPVQAKHLKKTYRLVMWDVMSYDFHPRVSPAQCLHHVLNAAGSGSVVVFHDSYKASEKLIYTLPLLLEHFSSLGFSL